ncbi:MAG: sulfatase [Myxococcota bacterium]
MTNTLLQKNWPWLVAGSLILLWLLSTSIRFELPIGDPRPLGGKQDILQLTEREDLNVLFVVIDTLRADRLGMYGYRRNTSPQFDRWTETGLRFGRHLAQSSWTKASMASLWTSLYPMRTGVTRYDDVISEEAVMPAERLREAGFKTIGIYRNGWVAPTFGFDQGFDVYTHAPRRKLNPEIRAKNPTITTEGNDEDTVAAGIEFLRVSGHDGRWFLYMHLMDLHEFVYDEESAVFGASHSDMYDNSIRWTDGTLDVLFNRLAEFGLSQKTLVVLTSDHGEAFRERGLEGHARAVYRETTEIPLVMFFPFKLDPGLVVPTRTQGIDVWPTIFELIGLAPFEDTDGLSRVPEILAAADGEVLSDSATMAFSFLDENWGRQTRPPRHRLAVSEGPYRFVVRSAVQGVEASKPIEELFDAESDPRELNNLFESETEIADRLRKAGEEWLAAVPSWGAAPKREIGELELNQLRALGYAIP